MEHVSRRDLIRIAEIRSALASGGARRAREAAGVKVCEIAGAIGVTPAAVSQWELHRRVPGTAHALAYARALDAITRPAA